MPAGNWKLEAGNWKLEAGGWSSARKRRFSVLRRRDAFFDERVPFMAVRALPEQFRASVPAAHADVRIDVEDRVVGEIAVALHQRGRELQLRERLPDRLVQRERVRMESQRLEEESESFGRLPMPRQVPRRREPCPPFLR